MLNFRDFIQVYVFTTLSFRFSLTIFSEIAAFSADSSKMIKGTASK